ncbi:MAG: hypothetical protein AAFQ80_08060 [Cyanobacteria bacterium J06621_8]
MIKGETKVFSVLEHLLSLASVPESEEAICQLKEIKVIKLFDKLLKDKLFIEGVAHNSFIHPNGFYKIVIAEGNQGERLRIHFWSEKEKTSRNKCDIHDHFWSFTSLVLFGNIYSEIFEPTKASNADDYTHFKLRDLTDQSYELEKMELVQLLCTERNTLSQGDIYSLSDSQLHRVECPCDTATFVLQGRRRRKENNIYVNYTEKKVKKASLRQLTVSEVIWVFNTIKTHLLNQYSIGY